MSKSTGSKPIGSKSILYRFGSAGFAVALTVAAVSAGASQSARSEEKKKLQSINDITFGVAPSKTKSADKNAAAVKSLLRLAPPPSSHPAPRSYSAQIIAPKMIGGSRR